LIFPRVLQILGLSLAVIKREESTGGEKSMRRALAARHGGAEALSLTKRSGTS
jgi:hypothetical protein